jgi:signal transduction histidine kinase
MKALMLAIGMLGWWRTAWTQDVTEIRTAQFALAAAFSDDPRTAALLSTTLVSLPDAWRNRALPDVAYGWYRIELRDNPSRTDVWGYIPRAATNAQVFFNGVLIWSGGRMWPHPEQSWNRSILFPISKRLFHPGSNELEVLLGVDGNEPGVLSPVYVGDYGQLHRWSTQRDLLQRDGYFVACGVLFATGVYMLLFWARTNYERLFGLLGFGSLILSLRILEELVNDGDVESAFTATAALLAISGTSTAICLFNLFALEMIPAEMAIGRKWVKWGMWTCILGAAATVWGSPLLSVNPYVILNGWMWYGFPIALYIQACLLCGARRVRDVSLSFVAIAGFVWLATSVYDNLVAIRVLPGHWIYLGVYSGMLMAPCFAVVVINRYSRLSNEYRALSIGLEQRVAERQVRIEEQYRDLVESDQQRTILVERQRMMKDLHDGLGSELVGALNEVRAPSCDAKRVEEVLRYCLEELRMAIESIDPETNQLSTMLGALRYRVERRLQAANIRLIWEIEETPDIVELMPSHTINILRILQEAFTNTVKHALAASITLSLRQHDTVAELRYKDDGVGFQDNGGTHGLGIENMRQRARAAGLVLTIDSSAIGTSICLLLPLVRD